MMNKEIEKKIFRSMGLKGTWKSKKGMHIFYRIKDQMRDIKFAWQRAWIGWDSCCVWDIDNTMLYYLIEWLEVYKKTRHCLWWCPDGYELGEYDENCDRYILSNEQLDAVLDVLIFHLKMSNHDYCQRVLYGSCIYDDDYYFDNNTDYCRIERIRKQNQDAAFDMLKVFWNQLWD